jgi:hypothetical protein
MLDLEGGRTWTARDAPHWVDVYQQLVAFCRGVLAEPDADHNRLALYRRLRHFEQRLAYWETQLPFADP